MTPRKHAELIKAWADGYDIQLKIQDEWVDTSYPSFSPETEYRLKPKIYKYRLALMDYGWPDLTDNIILATEKAVESSEMFICFISP